MRNLGKKIKDIASEQIVDKLLGILLGVVVTLVAKSGITSASIENPLSAIMEMIVLLAIFVSTYVATSLIHIKPTKYKFHILSLEIYFEYHGDEVVVRQKMKARPNLRSQSKMFHRKTWFSDESFEFISITDGFVVEPSTELGNEYDFFVHFPRKYHFWETIEFTTEFRGNNKLRQYKNFYWYDVISPIDKLKINVSVPYKYTKRYAYLKVFREHENSVGAKTQKVDYENSYHWDIAGKPKLGWSYVFEWKWSKSELKKTKQNSRKNNTMLVS